MPKYTKIDAAGLLLDAAIDHFLAGDFITAIHCAGAAEELAGRELERLGGKTMPDAMWEWFDYSDIVDSKMEFITGINVLRDRIKHTTTSNRRTRASKIGKRCSQCIAQRIHMANF